MTETQEFKDIENKYDQLAQLPDLLNYTEVANYFRVSHYTIKRWAKNGKIQRILVGSQVRFDKQEIIRIINQGGV